MRKDEINYFLWIDVLRAIAIFMVVLVHTGQYGAGTLGLTNSLKNVIRLGAHGVQLFFLVSGFTMMLTFRRHQERESLPITNFFIRRFFRIAPMFYIAILYYLIQDGLGPRYWLGDAPNITTGNIVSSVLFINGFNPYFINSIVPGEWSIAVEMLFYALFPWLIYKFKKPELLVTMLVIVLIMKGFLQFILENNQMISDSDLWRNYLVLYFPSQLPIFVLGLILYSLINDEQFSIAHLATALLPIALVMTLGIPYVDNGLLNYGFLFFLLAILSSKIVRKNWFTLAVGWIGKVSYSIYLVHFAVLHWLERFHLLDRFGTDGKILAMVNFSFRYLLVLTVSIIIASFFFVVVEKPFIALGSKLIQKRERKEPVELPNV